MFILEKVAFAGDHRLCLCNTLFGLTLILILKIMRGAIIVEKWDQMPNLMQNGIRTQKLLSIIITCYNYEDYVEECIQSVLRQIGPEIELIIVDDGSTDQSGAIIQRFSAEAKVIKISNMGALQASLTGFNLSSGHFVYFLDADDVLCDGSLSLIVSQLASSLSKIQFKMLPIDARGRSIGIPFPEMKSSWNSNILIQEINKMGYYQTPPTSGNVYRRDVYTDLGDLSYERAIDGIAYLLAPFVGEVMIIDKPLAMYRNHGRNLSNFSKLGASQLVKYGERFRARIAHLDRIISARNIERRGFVLKEDYSYVVGMNIMSVVASGRRPSFSQINNYIRLLRREYRWRQQIILSIFACALYVSPSTIRMALVRYRIDQSYLHRSRKMLKLIYRNLSTKC